MHNIEHSFRIYLLTVFIVFLTVLSISSCGGGDSGGGDRSDQAGENIEIPIAPDSLTALAVSGSRINLEWNDSSDNEKGFSIARSLDGVSFITVDTVGLNIAYFNDTKLFEQTTYHYRVKAFNSVGASPYSDIAYATTLETAWAKVYDSGSNDQGRAIIPTLDGGFIVAGSGGSASQGAGAWVLKMTRSGAIEWEKSYGGPKMEQANAIVQTSDEGYVFAGYTRSFGNGFEDIWVVKLDAAGSMEWQKSYGGSHGEVAEAVIQTQDNGFLVVGRILSFATSGQEAWVLKLDANGSIEWQSAYGGPRFQYLVSAFQTIDGGYALAGAAEGNGSSSGINAWVVRLDGAGFIQWEATYGSGLESASAITQSDNGNMIVAGTSGSYSQSEAFWLMELKPGGTVQWQKSYGRTVAGTPSRAMALCLSSTQDGSWLLGGFFDHWQRDPWLMKLDTTGSPLWGKLYSEPFQDELFSVQDIGKDGHVMVGARGSYVIDRDDLLLMRCSPDGSIDFNAGSGFVTVDAPPTVINSSADPSALGAVAIATTVVPLDTMAQEWVTNAVVTHLAP